MVNFINRVILEEKELKDFFLNCEQMETLNYNWVSLKKPNYNNLDLIIIDRTLEQEKFFLDLVLKNKETKEKVEMSLKIQAYDEETRVLELFKKDDGISLIVEEIFRLCLDTGDNIIEPFPWVEFIYEKKKKDEQGFEKKLETICMNSQNIFVFIEQKIKEWIPKFKTNDNLIFHYEKGIDLFVEYDYYYSFTNNKIRQKRSYPRNNNNYTQLLEFVLENMFNNSNIPQTFKSGYCANKSTYLISLKERYQTIN